MRKQAVRFAPMSILALLAIAAAPLAAQTPTPAGSEFQINTYTTNNQWWISAAASAMGDRVVTWERGGPSSGIFAQRYDAAGSQLGGEFQVNTTNASGPRPDAAMDADGNFIIVWSNGNIIGQRFTSTGAKVGGEFTVNSYTTDDQIQPEVAMNHAGEFVVVWNGYAQDGDRWGIFGQRYDAGASPVGSEFQANTFTTGFQIYGNAAIAESGEFVVVWNSTFSEVYGQTFDSSGAKTGSEFHVNTTTASSQRNADPGYDLDGEFVVAWRSYNQDGDRDGVFGQLFTGSGAKVGGELQINSYTTGSQSIPALGRGGNGDMVVIWTQSLVVNESDVFGQLLSPTGTKVGDEFQANTFTTARQGFVAAAMDDAGNFITTWVSDDPNGPDQDGDQSGIFAQRFSSPCSETVTLPTAQWKMISLPCDPGASNTVAGVFGDDMTGTYGVDWIVYERNEAAGGYVALTLADPLELGVGYWIKTLDAGETVTVDSLSPAVTEVDLVAGTDGVQNLLGHPFDFDVCWGDVRVIDGASVLTLDQADPVVGSMRACDLEPADASCVMSRTMHKWAGGYTPFDGGTPGAEGTLESYDALWVKAFKPGIKLRVPARGSASCGGSGFAPGRAAPPVELLPEAAPARSEPWFMRLIVESDGLRDEGNLLGQLTESLDDRDYHDLEELPPFDDPYLTVVFPHPDWGDQAGDYATDFHELKPRRRRERWTFEVRASPEVEQVTLSWEVEPRSLMRRLKLIDRVSGQRIKPRRGGSYTFPMDGSPRRFTCKLRPGR